MFSEKFFKIKKTPLIAVAAFMLSLLLRVISEVFLTDGRTGLIKEGFAALNIVVCVFSLLFAVGAVAFMGEFTEFSPKGVSPDFFLVFVSFITAVLSVVDGLTTDCADTYRQWQVALVAVMGIINAVFFFAYALSGIIKVKIPKCLFAVPLVCSIVRIIRFFAITTSVTVITDNVFTLFSYASNIFFMLEFANVANAFGGKQSLKKLRIFGYSSAALSLLNTLPRLIKLLSDRNAIPHESIVSTLLSLSVGLFIFAITFNLFDKKIKTADNN